MSLTFNTTLGNGTTVTLPLQGTVNVTVDWGDGTMPQSITTADNLDYTYVAEGIYTVTISGSLTQFGNDWPNYNNAEKLISCTSFGELGITSLRGAFIGAENLSVVSDAIPSTVTDLSRMFSGATTFNQSLSFWDVSNVTNMTEMFSGAISFNQDLSSWNVGNVTNMRFMFNRATSFDQNLNSWDVSNVTNMGYMFNNATSFNQNLSNWNVSSVIDFGSMFRSAIYFNQDLSAWDLGSAEYTGGMFQNASSFNQDISTWDVSNVVSMEYMFSNTLSFNQDLSAWDVGYVINMRYMFQNALSFNQDLSTWDVGRVRNMHSMFSGAISFNQDLSAWDVSDVTDMNAMFFNAKSFNQDLSVWDVSSVKNMQDMFKGVKLSIVNYNNLLTSWSLQTLQSNVTFDAGISNYSEGAPADARQFIVDNYSWTITDGGMVGSTLYEISASTSPTGAGTVNGLENFSQHYGEGETVTLTAYPNYNQKFINWTENGTSYSAENPIEFEATQNKILVAHFEDDDTSEPMSITFNTALSIGTNVSLPLVGYVNVLVNWGDGTTEIVESSGLKNHTYTEEGTYTVTINGTLMQFGDGLSYPNAEKLIGVSSFGDLGLTSLRGAFRGAANLSEVPEAIPLTVTDLRYMFYYATSFNQDISAWDVSSVTDMNAMFAGAISFNQDLSAWDVSTVNNMLGMFWDAKAFNQDLSTWDVSGVTNMRSMFGEAITFNQNLNSWDVSSVTDMSSMFRGAISFNQDLSAWDVSSVKNMSDMFSRATSFNQDLSNWDVSSVTDMWIMFNGATSFNQDLSSWDVSKVSNMVAMFQNATSFNQDLSNWDVSNVVNMGSMFSGVKLSTLNYNSLLLSWSQQTLRNNVNFSAGESNYSEGAPAEARQSIIDNFGWTITDGGMVGALYEITASISPAGAGTVNGSENFSQHYGEGENAALTATPQTGYDFVNWTEDGAEVSIDATYSFTVTHARNMVANFVLQTFEVSASTNPGEGGSVTGAGTYSYGETATLTATPQTDYDFVNWTEDGAEVSSDATYSFTATQARILVANLTLKTSINELNSNTMFVVYPNPASETINIDIDSFGLNFNNIEIVVFDVRGQATMMDNFNIYQNKILLNVSHKTPGLYFIQVIIDGKKTQTVKVNIMR